MTAAFWAGADKATLLGKTDRILAAMDAELGEEREEREEMRLNGPLQQEQAGRDLWCSVIAETLGILVRWSRQHGGRASRQSGTRTADAAA